MPDVHLHCYVALEEPHPIETGEELPVSKATTSLILRPTTVNLASHPPTFTTCPLMLRRPKMRRGLDIYTSNSAQRLIEVAISMPNGIRKEFGLRALPAPRNKHTVTRAPHRLPLMRNVCFCIAPRADPCLIASALAWREAPHLVPTDVARHALLPEYRHPR